MDTTKNGKIKVVVIVAVILIIVIGIFGIYSYIDHKKKQYEVQEVSSYLYYPIYDNGKMGVISITGDIVIDPVYDNAKVPNPEKDVFILQQEGKTIVQNKEKENLFSEYEEVMQIDIKGTTSSIPYEKRVLRYKQNGKYGLIDYNGKVITKPIYDQVEGLENKEGELLVKQNNKYGVINQKGASIIKIQYDDIIADGYYDKEQKYALSRLYCKHKNTVKGIVMDILIQN